MGNVLKMVKVQQIQALAALGWSNRAISNEIGVDRDTVAKYRFSAQNPPIVPAEPLEVPTDKDSQNPPEVPAGSLVALPKTNSAQLRPFVSQVATAYLGRLTAQRIYQDLVDQHGYVGSYDSVKRYVRKLAKKHRGYRERLIHLPGREAQVDFGQCTAFLKIDGRYKRCWFFKMTLSCSKHAYEEIVERQDLETFIRCHERAFAFFGGVTEIVTIDNVKSAVIQASLYDPVLNATYFSFATHWGFAVNPCKPRTPEHKGVVERDVGYTKHNALDGRRFESIEDGNAALRYWNKRWARTRIHGTTKCQVWKLFCDLERPTLRPLAEKPFEYFTSGIRKVDVNGLIEVGSSYYGVPPRYVGESIVVHFNLQWVKVFSNGILLITHRRLQQKGKISNPLSCNPEWKHPDLESQERYYLREARRIGPCTHTLVYKTLSENHPLSIRRVRGLLHLARKHGSTTAEEAADIACRVPHLNRYKEMSALCEKIASGVQPKQEITQQHDLIRPLTDYELLIN